MWPRKRFDIGWMDLLGGLAGCATRWDRAAALAQLEALWSERGDALACLSVRSGWDLLLSAAAFPRGSEVLISAVTIPDMARIIEHHGLVPVPLDLDVETILPSAARIEAAVTPRTKAVLIAHLFGTSSPLDAQIAAARRHGLLFVEDCAQAFRGRSDTGHPEADVSMFSFGTIKTATALGGGLLRVRDPQVLARMREIQAGYPVQPRGAYLQRLVKYVGLKSLTYRPTFQALVGVLRLMGRDHDRMLNASIRGFPADRLFELIRQQPCAPLLQLLARRIRTFDEARQVRRTERGRQLAADLNGAFPCPAAELRPHVFWVFPLLAERPVEVLAHLRRHGFDGTQGQSMVAIKPPPGREECDPVAAREIVARLLFLPFYGAMPDAELRRMAGVLREYAPSVAPAKTHTALQPVA